MEPPDDIAPADAPDGDDRPGQPGEGPDDEGRGERPDDEGRGEGRGERPDDEGRGEGPDDEGMEVEYDGSAWAAESRDMLAHLLGSRGIPHVWQGTTLTVRPRDGDLVEELVDEVLAVAGPALDPAADRVVYEVGSWPAAMQSMLADSLTVADLPYEWDEHGDLVVYAEHEDEVEAILDEMPDPDDPELVGEVSADDGIAVHELLDRLFVASARLASKDDPSSILAVDETTAVLERMGPPFGFEPPQWRALLSRAVVVRDALAASPGDAGELSDVELRAAAGALRDLVRRYV